MLIFIRGAIHSRDFAPRARLERGPLETERERGGGILISCSYKDVYIIGDLLSMYAPLSMIHIFAATYKRARAGRAAAPTRAGRLGINFPGRCGIESNCWIKRLWGCFF